MSKLNKNQLGEGSVDSNSVLDGTIDTPDIKNSAVTDTKIANGSIGKDHIKDNAGIPLSKLDIPTATESQVGLMSIQHASDMKTLVADYNGTRLGFMRRFALINILQSALKTVDGVSALQSELQNGVLVELFNDQSQIESSSGLSIGPRYTCLKTAGTETLVEDFESGSWSVSGTNATVSLSSSWKTSGTNSLRIYINSFETTDRIYSAYKTISANWSRYDGIMIDVKLVDPTSDLRPGIRINNKDTFTFYKSITRPLSNEIRDLCLSFCGKQSSADIKHISKLGFGAVVPYALDSAYLLSSAEIYFDNLRLISGATGGPINLDLNSSGGFVSTTRTTSSDITSISLVDYRSNNPGCTITADVSMDGGSNWKTNIPTGTHLGTWAGGYLEKADSDVAWNNLRNLKIRYNFTSSASTKTPSYLHGYTVLIEQ